MSTGKKAGKGFTSFLYRNILEKLVGMVAMIILARELSPYDFGLVSITEVLLFMISVLGTTGLAEYLLAYRGDDKEELFKAAFWFNIVITLCILVVFWIAAPLWASYQGDDRIWKLSFLVGGVFLFSQLQGIPKTWLSKHMQFETQVKLQAPFILLTAIGKIAAVYLGLGVYSLVIPTLLFQPIITFLFYRSVSFRPTLNLYISRWKEIYRFTRHLIGASILSRLADQGDKIILGKILGLEMLGIYSIAAQLADLLTSQLVMVSNSILSAVLPQYVDDKERFYNHYISFLKTFAFLMLPLLGIMLVAAGPIILMLYGAKWQAAVLPAQILLVYAMLRVVTSSYGCVMNSFHLTKESFKVTLLYTPFHLLGSAIGSLFGISGVATSAVAVKSAFVNLNIKQVMRAVGKPVYTWYKDLAPYFVNVYSIMLLLLLAFSLGGAYAGFPPFLVITIIAVTFLSAYYLSFMLFFRDELRKISSFLGITFPRSQTVFKFLFRI